MFWDGTGLCLFIGRLEDGIFCWPKIEDGVMRLSAALLSALLQGLLAACLRGTRDAGANASGIVVGGTAAK
ncbi:IS66 family insertion sequence element accessory protein TnpB [Bradyrhizobium shewense]